MAVNVDHSPTRFEGYWTPSTATLDWCEENYHHTPFIAEFWNTVSNLGYIIAGVLGFYQCLRVKSSIPPRYAFLFAWMAVIGIGSLLFHATLLYSMQLLDEIPMLFSNSQMLYVLWHPETGLNMVKSIPKSLRSSAIPYFAFSIGITALYIANPSSTLFFQVSYGAMVLLMAVSLHFYALQISDRSVKILLERAAFFIIAAFALWNVDNLMCAHLRRIRTEILPPFFGPFLQFHAWWHILTMISGIHSLTAVLVAWCKTNPKRLESNKILWKLTTFWNGMVPWILFSQKLKK